MGSRPLRAPIMYSLCPRCLFLRFARPNWVLGPHVNAALFLLACQQGNLQTRMPTFNDFKTCSNCEHKEAQVLTQKIPYHVNYAQFVCGATHVSNNNEKTFLRSAMYTHIGGQNKMSDRYAGDHRDGMHPSGCLAAGCASSSCLIVGSCCCRRCRRSRRCRSRSRRGSGLR